MHLKGTKSRGLREQLDGSLKHIELFDQYYEGNIDRTELTQQALAAGLCSEWEEELDLYLQAIDCINLGRTRQDIVQIICEENPV